MQEGRAVAHCSLAQAQVAFLDRSGERLPLRALDGVAAYEFGEPVAGADQARIKRVATGRESEVGT